MVLRVVGVPRLRSDMPPPCLAQSWTPASAPVEYVRCRTCNLSWVCRSCAGRCHAGHDVEVFLRNHTPSFACCYCFLKRKTSCCYSQEAKEAEAGR